MNQRSSLKRCFVSFKYTVQILEKRFTRSLQIDPNVKNQCVHPYSTRLFIKRYSRSFG